MGKRLNAGTRKPSSKVSFHKAPSEEAPAAREKRLKRDLDKGRTTQAKIDAILARIHPADGYDGLADVQLVIESVFEDRAVKQDVIGRICAIASGICSNKSGSEPSSSKPPRW